MKTLIIFCVLFSISRAMSQGSIPEAKKLIDAKNFDGARTMLEGLVKTNDNDAGSHFELGLLMARHYGDWDAAQDQIERAVELNDAEPEYHFVLGQVYGTQARIGSPFKALFRAGKVKDQFLRAVDLSPRAVRYRRGLMEFYLQAPGIAGGSVAKAGEQADSIRGIDPYEGEVALGEVAAYDKEFAGAEKHYLAAVAVGPSKWRAYHLLGYLYLNQKRFGDAIAQFRNYTKIAPEDPNSHDSLGEGLLANGNTEEALQEYGRALALNARFASSVIGSARCCEAKGNKVEALRYYRQYLDLNPTGQGADEVKKKVKELEG